MKITCALLTRNAGEHSRAMIAALSRQSLCPLEILVLDSSSCDGTAERFAEAGAKVVTIEPNQFHHARTRNLAVEMATGEAVVFLTQDAVPASDRTLEALVAPLVEASVVAAFGRHVAYPEASPLERFARSSNYPPESRITSKADVAAAGIRAFFFSNSCSAVRRESLLDLGGFPDGTVMNEDMLFAAKALRHDFRLAYVAEAVVWHSHRYSPLATFRRYFDIGTVFTDAAEDLAGVGTDREGIRYARGLVAHLAREGLPHWIPAAVLETMAKAAGYWTGRNYRSLPRALLPRLSLHPNYWQSTRRKRPPISS